MSGLTEQVCRIDQRRNCKKNNSLKNFVPFEFHAQSFCFCFSFNSGLTKLSFSAKKEKKVHV